MTHQKAVEQMMVERYMLGELAGVERDQFEEHLFACVECAAELKQGIVFVDASRRAFASSRKETGKNKVTLSRGGAPNRLLQPWALISALAACLAVIVYQSAIVFPHLRAAAVNQVALNEAPAVIEPLVLANAGARGDSSAKGDSSLKIVVPHRGYYLLSVDVPSSPGVQRYRCVLISPTGATVWHVDLSAQQIRDAVTIQVPVSTAQEGLNELRIQGFQAPQDTLGQSFIELADYRYKLIFAK